MGKMEEFQMDDAALRQLAVHLAAQLPADRERALAAIELLKELAETWLYPEEHPVDGGDSIGNVIEIMTVRDRHSQDG
jgi:hypothetical protein